jgi:hypothetical protein
MPIGTTNFPAALDTTETLIQAADNAITTLSSQIDASVTTIPVVATASFPSNGIFSIENELISYTGKTSTTFTGCTRGFDGTTAVTHASSSLVEQEISSIYHRTMVSALIATQTKIGAGTTANRVIVANGSGNYTASDLTHITADAAVGNVGAVDFDTTPPGSVAAGRLIWNDTEGTLDLGLKGGNIALHLGQRDVSRIVNKTGATLNAADYKVVRISTAQGQRLGVNLAQANSEASSTDILGIVSETIADNAEGFITTRGLITGINTTGGAENWADGDVLYLSPSVAGGLTKTKPTAPNHLIIVGYVIYAHANNGKLFIAIQTSWELDELHNVLITSPTNNQVLSYDSANSRWRNAAVTVTAAGTNGQYQINNSTALGAGSLTEATSEVTSSKPLRLPSSGTSSDTQLQLGTANNGIYFSGALIAISSSAAAIMAWNGANGNTVINSAYTLAWGSSGFSTEDIGLNRHAAGVVRVNNAGASAGQLLVGPSSATIDGQAHIVSASASRPGLRIDSAATPTAPVLDVRVNGTADSGIEVDGSTTSGHTRFLLYDVTSGALQRVLVGANDSGGSGYRVLRIANA